MTKCSCKCQMSLLQNPCTRKPFGCHRCVPRQKNTGKIWYVQTTDIIDTTRRNFPAFGQKLFWDFFPIPDPCECPPEQGDVYITITVDSSGYDASEVQTVTIVGFPKGGTFTLSYRRKTTEDIPFNASASLVQTRLAALSTIGAGNVSVTGPSGGPYEVEFIGDLAGAPYKLKADSSQLVSVNAYEPVPGLSEADEKLVECVAGIVGMRTIVVGSIFDYEWFKIPRKNIAEGLELIVYMYFLRGSWRLTLRYSDYTEVGGIVETLRGVAHYTSEAAGCFYDEPQTFTFESYTATLLLDGLDTGESALIQWPETATFQTRDVGDFFKITPIDPPE